jgi:phosphatidylinositol glycan class W
MLVIGVLIWILHPGCPPVGKESRLIRLREVDGQSKVEVTFWNQVKATTMLGTVLAIVAVDFPFLFQRMHTKSEEYGISVMDSGVALITINAGLSSRKARPWFKQPNTFLQEFAITLKQTIVPICLGFARILVVKELDYQEHASEYGTHWNFFTTITVIHIAQVFVTNPKFGFPIAFTLMFLYEMVLKTYELEVWIFHAPRIDFFSANREGICSLVGYFSL